MTDKSAHIYDATLIKPTKREYVTMANALNAVLGKLGGSCAAARALGISAQAVSQWDIAPPHRCRQIEKACNKFVTRYQLRPDIFGDGSDV